MTSQEICTLSEVSLDKVRALKQDFDAAFEILVTSGSGEDLQKVEALKRQIKEALSSQPIARSPEQMNNKTLIYIGQLERGMFKNFPRSIERFYTSFPDSELQLESLSIGGKTSKELRELMQKNHIKLSDYAENELDVPDFVTSKQSEEVDLIKLKVEDLGLGEAPTTDEIYNRIKELGLELCPPEVGPRYLLAHLDQAMGDWVAVGMKPVADQEGRHYVLNVGRSSDSLWLNDVWARPDFEWNPHYQFLFRVRRGT